MLPRLPSLFSSSRIKNITRTTVLLRGPYTLTSAKFSSDHDTFGSLTEPLEYASKRKPEVRKSTLQDEHRKVPSFSSRSAFAPNSVDISEDKYPRAKGRKFDRAFIKNDRKPGNNRKTFGDLSKTDPHFKLETTAQRDIPEENDCIPSETFKPLDVKRKRFIDYSIEIKELGRQGKLKEAIELFESLSDLGVTYQKKTFLYSIIITACAKRGYTQKAFQIYTKMRQQGLRPSPAVLTGLFNACAECPFPQYGLEKAQNLHRKMQEEGWHPNQITYHAMIKAYGRCGYLAGAFLLVDEMKNGKFAITDETFTFLLQACISDTEAGFTHAIGVMRKMRTMKIKPSHYSYNMLLRAVRDCGIGPPDVSSKLLLEWTDTPLLPNPTKNDILPSNAKPKQLNSKHDEVATESSRNPPTILEDKQDSNSNSLIPDTALLKSDSEMKLREVIFDLLSPVPPNTNILAIGEVKTSADRLALIGGSHRILNKLINLGEKPNIRTVTLLLECQDSSCEAETSLLSHMKKIDLRPDVDFFNVMVKKRCSRRDYSGARQVLEFISEYGLYPDIATFGTLSMTCLKRRNSVSLLNDMRNCGFRPNLKILGALMRNACNAMDFAWMQDLMRQAVVHNVKPCGNFLGQLEKAWKDATHALVLMEKGEREVPAWAEKENFAGDYKNFCLDYKNWLKSVEVELPEHPWKQFRPDVKNKSGIV